MSQIEEQKSNYEELKGISEENKRIAKKIRDIVSSAHGNLGKGGNEDNSKSARFRRIDRSDVTVDLNSFYGRPAHRFVPESFTLPSYIFTYNPPSESAVFSTPYGDMPRNVIGADNQLYGFGASFYVSEDGHGLKEEHIYHGGDVDKTREEGLNSHGYIVPRIALSNLSRGIWSSQTDIADGDRELIWSVLYQVENSKFIEY